MVALGVRVSYHVPMMISMLMMMMMMINVADPRCESGQTMAWNRTITITTFYYYYIAITFTITITITIEITFLPSIFSLTINSCYYDQCCYHGGDDEDDGVTATSGPIHKKLDP